MVAFSGPQLVKNRNVALVADQLLHVTAALARPGHGQQLAPSMATGSVATMLTRTGRLVGGGSAGKTLMSTGSETVDAPPLSVALAIKAKLVPTGGLVQTSAQ